MPGNAPPRIIQDILLDMQRLAPALEHKRRLYNFLLLLGVSIIVIALFAFILSAVSPSAVTHAALIGLGLMPCFLLYRIVNRIYRKSVHRAFVDVICKRGNLDYSDTGYLQASELQKHNILPAASHHSSGEGIKGSYHDVSFTLQELSLKDNKVISFWGVIARINTARSFEGHTVILPRSWLVKGLRQRFSSWNAITPMARKFEGSYETLSSDPVEARAVMPPVFMERFMEAGQLPGSKWMGISLQGREVIVAYPRYNPLFVVPPLWQPLSVEAMQRFIWEIESLFRIIDVVRGNPQIQT